MLTKCGQLFEISGGTDVFTVQYNFPTLSGYEMFMMVLSIARERDRESPTAYLYLYIWNLCEEDALIIAQVAYKSKIDRLVLI